MNPFPAFDWDSFLARFGGNPSTDGEGVERTFSHTWNWPPWVTLLLLILLVIFLLRIYRREPLAKLWQWRVLAATRITIVALVIFMMYGWAEHRHRTELPELVVAVDTSSSMASEDRYQDQRVDRAIRQYFADDPSRLGQAKVLLTSEGRGWLQTLRQRYRIKVMTMSDAVRELTVDASDLVDEVKGLDADGPTSHLGDALREMIDRQRGRSTAAMVLLTDGITTEGPTLRDVAEYAKLNTLPLYIVGLGSEQPPRDLRLSELLVDDVAFVGDVLNFDVQLHSSGIADRQATVRLRQDGEETSLAEVTVTLANDAAPQSVRLPYRPLEEGDFEYVVEVDTFEDELNHDNNRISRRVSVRNATIRVLLVQSSPSYEYRYLKSLLSRAIKLGTSNEKAFELTTVLQEADVDYIREEGDTVAVFPIQRDELFEYDVLIFGDANPSFFSRSVLENIREFVEERGGGVIFIGGPQHFPKQYQSSPLAPLLPFDVATAMPPADESVIDESFQMLPTSLGLESPTLQIGDSDESTGAVWTQLPELRWLLEIPDVNTTAMVLAEHPLRRNPSGRPLPVILMHFFGAGKVIFHATDETFLWARHQGSDRYYARYWHQTIRYLSRSKLLADRRPVEIMTDAQQYLRGDAVRMRVLFRDERLAPAAGDGVTVTLDSEPDRQRSIVLLRDSTDRGLFEATLDDLAVGTYEAELASPLVAQPPPPVSFAVDSLMREGSRMEMDADDLRSAASTSEGRFFTIRNASRLLSALPDGDQVRIESSPPRPIWNSSWLAVSLVALLLMEWILRKRAGLL